MGAKREHTRYLIKLPIDIRAGEDTIRGVTVRVSRKGLFARSQTCFAFGTKVDMVMHITDEMSCKLTGVVKYTRNIIELKRQNGMGIELTGMDRNYQEYITSVEEEKA